MPFLYGTAGQYTGERIPIAEGIFIGSDPKQSHLVIRSLGVFDRHCGVAYDRNSGLFYVQDFSGNGVYKSDGTRIEYGTSVPFSPGEEIVLGDGVNRFRLIGDNAGVQNGMSHNGDQGKMGEIQFLQLPAQAKNYFGMRFATYSATLIGIIFAVFGLLSYIGIKDYVSDGDIIWVAFIDIARIGLAVLYLVFASLGRDGTSKWPFIALIVVGALSVLFNALIGGLIVSIIQLVYAVKALDKHKTFVIDYSRYSSLGQYYCGNEYEREAEKNKYNRARNWFTVGAFAEIIGVPIFYILLILLLF